MDRKSENEIRQDMYGKSDQMGIRSNAGKAVNVRRRSSRGGMEGRSETDDGDCSKV